MVSYGMAFPVDLLDDFRVVFDFYPYWKKSGRGPLSFKDLQQGRGGLGVRSVIKGQGYLLSGCFPRQWASTKKLSLNKNTPSRMKVR